MTGKQYRRLLLVLTLPLLLAGFLFATIVAPYGEGPFITCEQMTTEFENCRPIGWEGNLHDNVMKSQPAWFDVQLTASEMEGPLFSAVQGSQRVFDDARIIGASPYNPHGPEVASLMGGFAGRNAAVVLGIADGQKSLLFQDGLLLLCNSLNFQDAKNEYEAGCFGDGWAGPVRFTLGKSGEQKMELLRRSVQEEIDRVVTDYRLYQVMMYPLFLYLFLIGSALVWLGLRAYRYVRAG